MDFTPKRIGEREIYGVDYTNILKMRPGVSIASAIWRNTVAFGTDPSPASMIDGAASIVGSVVSTFLIGGVIGCGYNPVCDATLSDGEIVTLPDIGDGLVKVYA